MSRLTKKSNKLKEDSQKNKESLLLVYRLEIKQPT